MNNYCYHGHVARKRFGQIFLHDRHVINEIVTIINPTSDQRIVEIGPGLGALTEPVFMLAKHLIVIEIDRDLVARLMTNPIFSSKIKILQQDVMTVDFINLATEFGQPIRIFSNLPYNISTPFLFYLFPMINSSYIADLHLMLQKELVNRLIAVPNSKHYGRLSVMARYYCQIIRVLTVPAKSFRPIPQVDSEMVRLVPYLIKPYLVHDLQKLSVITNLSFNQRRKTLRNSLRSMFSVSQLQAQGIDATMRAENLTCEQYYRLANVLYARPPDGSV